MSVLDVQVRVLGALQSRALLLYIFFFLHELLDYYTEEIFTIVTV